MLALALLIFYLRESRNEVFYLCSNFTPGTPAEKVIEQLNTAILSGYERRTQAGSETVTLSASYFPGLFHCRIMIQSGEVTQAQWSVLDQH